MTDQPYDPATDGARMAFADAMSYGDYLGLDRLLSAQHCRTETHDEMLFIIQHQTSELWMKLALHEIGAARDAIAQGTLRPAFKMLSRVSRIFEQLNNQWDVLRTMTPADYAAFRDALGQSSGFQSWQYRLIEYSLGNRNRAMMRPHAHVPQVTDRLAAELARPSLYHVALDRLDAAIGLPEGATRHDMDRPYRPQEAVEEAWRAVYRDTGRHWELYELAEKLVDFEDYFRRWRFNHVTTVERVIGFKRGTGGTGGVSYLRRMLEVELFPELWHLRTGF